MRKLISVKRGFSLIELVVVTGLLVIVFGVAVLVFSQVIRTANRAHIASMVRSEAAFALSEMVRDIQEAERVTTSIGGYTNYIELQDSEGNCYLSYGLSYGSMPLTCDSVARDNGCDGSWDDNLTSNSVEVTGLAFSQNLSRVDINITVEQCSTSTRPEFQGSITLQEGVNLRNYAAYQ